jgi:2-iminobutanoate/2-iminopropanoate deaminase
MERSVIRTSQAPAAIGPYSQAVVVPVGGDRMIFCSGQIPLDPATGQLVEGDITVMTRRVLDNLAAVLAEAGAGWQHVVKTTMFLADLGDFLAVNKVYAERFGAEAPPARSTIQVAKLPRDARVEIEAVAVVPGTSGR